MGLVNLGLLIVLPAVWTEWTELPSPSPVVGDGGATGFGLPELIAAALLTAVLILAFGTIHQWLLLVVGRVAAPITFVLAAMAVFIPLTGSFRKQTEWLMSFSPAMHYAHWLTIDTPRGPKPAFSFLVVTILYLLVFMIFWYLLRTRMAKLEAWVDYKLRSMGALPPT
jgi:hypothetical protein